MINILYNSLRNVWRLLMYCNHDTTRIKIKAIFAIRITRLLNCFSYYALYVNVRFCCNLSSNYAKTRCNKRLDSYTAIRIILVESIKQCIAYLIADFVKDGLQLLIRM